MREIRRNAKRLQVFGWQEVMTYFLALAEGAATAFETAAFDHAATAPGLAKCNLSFKCLRPHSFQRAAHRIPRCENSPLLRRQISNLPSTT
jgi:hypothetical protein